MIPDYRPRDVAGNVVDGEGRIVETVREQLDASIEAGEYDPIGHLLAGPHIETVGYQPRHARKSRRRR